MCRHSRPVCRVAAAVHEPPSRRAPVIENILLASLDARCPPRLRPFDTSAPIGLESAARNLCRRPACWAAGIVDLCRGVSCSMAHGRTGGVGGRRRRGEHGGGGRGHRARDPGHPRAHAAAVHAGLRHDHVFACHVGPDFGASENVRPHTLRVYLWTSTFLVAGLLECLWKPPFLLERHVRLFLLAGRHSAAPLCGNLYAYCFWRRVRRRSLPLRRPTALLCF